MADMRMQLVLGLRDKVLGPLDRIRGGSEAAAHALKSTRDRLRELEKIQQDVAGMRNTRIELRGQQRDLTGLQDKLTGHNTGLNEQRERHRNITASLKTARESHARLTKALQDGAAATPQFSRELEMARTKLLSSQSAYERSNATIRQYRGHIKNTQNDIAQLTGRISRGQERVQGYERRLQEAGIGTDRLGQKSRSLKTQIDAATAAVDKQKLALAALKAQQDRIGELKAQHTKAMMHTGMVAGGGVTMVAAGRAISRPVQATLGTFAQQENASTQLRASMMQADGSVSAEFEQIDALAKRLGDRLPGTTADFVNMMTVLRKEGISAQAILGGTGEAAALLGVQLEMPVVEAAAFAAKMQDATQATEGEMLGLMDMLQKNAYLGADQNYQLAGITKMAGAMSLLRKKGVYAYKDLSPILVMMNQAGMTDGSSAGNAIDKIFAAGLNGKKLEKTNAILAGTGIKLNFADKDGKFAGIENLFKQLDKLKKLGDNDVLKTAVLSELFGTDAQNMQVLRNFMAKGFDGYKEATAKMEAQASLQQRVESQLGTLSNVMEAAQGGFTNVMASIGETVQGDAKGIINGIGDISSRIGAWVKEHPVLTANIVRTVAALAALTAGLGLLLVPLALIMGKVMLVRFGLGILGVKLPGLISGVRGLAGALGPGLQGAAAGAARAVPAALASIGLAMQAPARGAGAWLQGMRDRMRGTAANLPRTLAQVPAVMTAKASTALQGIGTTMARIPEAAAATGRSIHGAFARAGAAIAAANARLWAHLAAQKAAAVASARRGVVSVATYAVMRGPTGIARDAVAGLAGLARSGIVGTLGAIRMAFMGVAQAVLLVGRALLLNPMGLAIAAIAGGALLILKYWHPIRAFFSGLWEGFTQGLAPLTPMFSAVFGTLGSALAPLRPLWDGLVGTFAAVWGWVSRLFAPFQATQQSLTGATQAGHGFGAWLASLVVSLAKLVGTFYNAGRDIVSGLINGIASMGGAVGETISRLAGSTIGWFKEKLGIHSPSRVFIAAGVNVGEGAAIGIGSTADMVRKSAALMATAAAVSLPVPTMAMPAIPAMQSLQTVAAPAAGILPSQPDAIHIDRRPPIAMGKAAGPAPVIQGDTITLHIHAAPGMDEQAIARLVTAELERRERIKTARTQAAFYDWNS